MSINLLEDCHVHSSYSDGVNTIEENIKAATSKGLTTLVCVDHVRKETTWVPEFAAVIRNIQTPLKLYSGIEAKLLNQSGELDLPEKDCHLVDRIYAADHRFPLGNSCKSPREIRELIKSTELSKQEAINIYFQAMHRVLERYDNVTFAHIFSILPKIKIAESDIPQALLIRFAQCCRSREAIIEIDERWRCPGARAIKIFIQHGVKVVASTDSHRAKDIGHYDYVKSIVDGLTS